MNDFVVHRVVLACDPVGEHDSIIAVAARFAAWWNAALHAVFVEDEALLNLAALPFARHIAASGEIAKDYDANAMLQQFEAHADRLRAALEAAAHQYAVGWSFDVVRGHPTLATLALDDQDLLVIESASRPFAGEFRLDSRWLAAAFEAHRSILLVRNAAGGKNGVTVLVQKPGPSADRAVTAAAKLARAGDRRLTVFTTGPGFDPAALRAEIRRVSERIATHCRMEQVGIADPIIAQAADRSTLLVVDADPAVSGVAMLKEIAARTSANILFIR